MVDKVKVWWICFFWYAHVLKFFLKKVYVEVIIWFLYDKTIWNVETDFNIG